MSRITPYHSQGDITLYNGDCRELLGKLDLPWERVVLVTDPVWPQPMRSLVGAEDPWGLFADLWMQIPVLKRAAIHVGVVSDPRFLGFLPDSLAFFQQLLMSYPVPSFSGRQTFSEEVCYLFGDPPPTWVSKRFPGHIRANAGREATNHPCPRKLEHVRQLVGMWTEPDDLILDPFCGSGTTLLAAQYWGRSAVGMEIVEEHAAEAAERLQANELELWGHAA